MTEDEAKTKWCPFARVSSLDARYNKDDPGRLATPGYPSYNRQFIQDFDATQKLQGDGSHSRMNLIPSGACCLGSGCMAWRWQFANKPSGDGFCGLAS